MTRRLEMGPIGVDSMDVELDLKWELEGIVGWAGAAASRISGVSVCVCDVRESNLGCR